MYGAYKYFWRLADYNDENEDINSVITYLMTNCKTNELKIIVFLSYSGQMGKGNIIDDLIVAEKSLDLFVWNIFPAGTSQGAVLNQVCKIR